MIELCRGKEENTGEWVYGYYTLYPKCNGLHPCILTGTEYGCIIPKFIDLDTLGSCTDMVDVNDKEMFEGDILKISSPNPNYNYLTVIYNAFNTLCINVPNMPKEDSNVCAIGFAESAWNEYECTVEVIGNIYDNPELLTGEVKKEINAVTDSTTAKVTDKEMELINAYSRRKLTKDEVYVFGVVLCDNDIDRDNERFTVESLFELEKLFVGKTGIFDHSPTAKNQTARIFACSVESVGGRKTANGDDYFRLTARAYIPKTKGNEEIIQAIDSGILKEVSIGCAADEVKCSVCGESLNHCSHIKGETYGGRKCYGELCGISAAYEWSFVAVPAQKVLSDDYAYNVAKLLDTVPIADVQEVIRCKDCIFGKYDDDLNMILCKRIYNLSDGEYVYNDLNDFCSYSERK